MRNKWILGTVPYLNAKPLVAMLEGASEVRLVEAVPSALAGMLARREVDAALVSSFVAASDPALCILRAGAVTSNGPVRSIRLFSRVPLREIGRLALDTSSRTGVTLARVMLSRVHGVRPEIVSLAPDLPRMLAEADAALMIGDPAMLAGAEVERGAMPDVQVDVDLGALWREQVGLPFVYAGWTAPKDCECASLAALLREATEWGLARLPQIAQREAPLIGLPQDLCIDYLRHNVHYEFGPMQWKGLEEFQRACAEEGLIPAGLPPVAVAG